MDVLAHERQIEDCKKMIEQLKAQSSKQNPFWTNDEIKRLESKLETLKKKVYSNLSPWERVTICRHPARPHSIDFLHKMCDSFTELCGDRTFKDDRALIGGLATIGNEKFVVIGQEKGSDTDSRIHHNFGMSHPEGFRKALRLMKLAEKFKLPVLSLIDTPGAYPGLAAEERGQGAIIAENIMKMSRIQTPIIVLIIGEGCSGGALANAVGDVVGMLEHAYYSVISPEGCASILWKDPAKNSQAASTLKLNAEDLLEFGIIDHIIKEPLGGAHHDPQTVFKDVKTFVLNQWESLKHFSLNFLLESRYCKYRRMGKFITANELNELHE